MKLNPDCVRDVLLLTENETGYCKYLMVSRRNCLQLMPGYTEDEILYHITQCQNFNFIKASDSLGAVTIMDLTPKGHAFLENIRDNDNWSATKKTASKVGSFSLDVLSNIAASISAALISKNL